ncbi:hypothetical protein SNOG_20149 [Parastagonospora nodorum SN15]|uniref:Uncharacterized protein n=1 Tax=Phaeosphaeria nodorum (strain SN15 / ATCC MYA-4574 / FGSC 10173) TaxID=321614 RepID=A9JXE5_PHANO|nr:hypothetical protein SNOG_20149 [Parastagonospora nodorum SN15]EDP89835.1 hypothetical protein SNOG_20149 [Parastagonospora nodorum SN15]
MQFALHVLANDLNHPAHFTNSTELEVWIWMQGVFPQVLGFPNPSVVPYSNGVFV